MKPIRSRITRPTVDPDALRRLTACSDVDTLTAAVDDIAGQLGFEHWIYGALLPVTPTRTEQFVLNGYPDEWRQHYLESGYTAVDPTVDYARQNVIPTLWDDLTKRPPEGTDARQGKRVFNEARAFGLAKGLSVPLHGLGCLFGMMSYAAADPRHPIMESTLYAEATLLATFVHQAASALMPGQANEKLPALTPRERECLKWAAEGKSGWEIGHVLCISERTAVFHIGNACRKLRVMTRQQAVAKALVLGLIGP